MDAVQLRIGDKSVNAIVIAWLSPGIAKVMIIGDLGPYHANDIIIVDFAELTAKSA